MSIGGPHEVLPSHGKRIVQVGQLINAMNATIVGLMILTEILRFEHLLIAAFLPGSVNSVMMPSRRRCCPVSSASPSSPARSPSTPPHATAFGYSLPPPAVFLTFHKRIRALA